MFCESVATQRDDEAHLRALPVLMEDSYDQKYLVEQATFVPNLSKEQFQKHINLSRVNVMVSKLQALIDEREKVKKDFWSQIQSLSKTPRIHNLSYFQDEEGLEMDGYFWDVGVEVSESRLRIILPNDGIFYRHLNFYEEDDTQLMVKYETLYHKTRKWRQFTSDQMKFFCTVEEILTKCFQTLYPELFDQISASEDWYYFGAYNKEAMRIDFEMATNATKPKTSVIVQFEEKYPSISLDVVSRMKKNLKPSQMSLKPSQVVSNHEKPKLESEGLSLFFSE